MLKAVKAGDLDQLLALSPPLAERYLQMQQAQAARAQDVRHREMEAAISWAMRDLEKDPEPRFGTLEDRRGLSMTFYVERLHVLHDALCGEHPSLRIRECLARPTGGGGISAPACLHLGADPKIPMDT